MVRIMRPMPEDQTQTNLLRFIAMALGALLILVIVMAVSSHSAREAERERDSHRMYCENWGDLDPENCGG